MSKIVDDNSEGGHRRGANRRNRDVTRATPTSEPRSDGVETALQTIETEVTHAHHYRQTLEDARAVVRFTKRVSSDEELLQVVAQLERVLEIEDGTGEL